MPITTARRRRWLAVPLAASAIVLTTSAPTAAQRSRFFEEAAEAFWEVPHECAGGATVAATLLVRSTRDFETPETEDPEPTARVQFLAVCPDGSSFSWGAATVPANIVSTGNLRSVTAAGAGTARDNLGATHTVSFDVAWTGVGPLERIVNAPGSRTKIRAATATGRVIFDGEVLADETRCTRPARNRSSAWTWRSSAGPAEQGGRDRGGSYDHRDGAGQGGRWGPPHPERDTGADHPRRARHGLTVPCRPRSAPPTSW